MIAIVDYQAGNLTSVQKAFQCFSKACVVTCDPAAIRRADKVVIPGVGHFSATSALAANGLRDAVLDCIQGGVPLLGICLGLQWLFQGSDEANETAGLGLFEGICTRFLANVKSPHVGWNQVHAIGASQLLEGVANDSFLYFTHSYRAPLVECTTAICQYGEPFTAIVERDNVFGVQFHPEKSGDAGLTIVENFCAL